MEGYKDNMLNVIILLILVQSSNSFPTLSEEYKNVTRTLSALDDLISWAKAHHDRLILDFMFSLRVIQGELEMLTEKSLYFWDPEIMLRIKLLQIKVEKLGYLAFSDEDLTANGYYSKFEALVSTKYYIPQAFAEIQKFDVKPKFVPATEHDVTFDENESDDCMIEIFGNRDTKKAACSLSEKCFLQMTDNKSEEYQLTHQILFFILAKLRKCEEELDGLARRHHTSIQSLTDLYTRKMYSRLPSVLDSGSYDLFTEMVMVGQMLNYEEFYSPILMELIYTWQDTTGCFRDESNETNAVYTITSNLRRRLLADEIIDEYCSEHFTAVALICFSQMLHYQLMSISPPQAHISRSVVGALGVLILLFFCLLKFKKLKFLNRLFI